MTSGALFQAAVSMGVGAILYAGLSPFALATAGLTLVAALTVMLLGTEAPLVLRIGDECAAAFPVRTSTLRAARAAHAVSYLVLGTTAAAVPIAVFVGFAVGSVKAGFGTYIAALLQALFFVSLGSGLDAVLGCSRVTSGLRPVAAFLWTGALVTALFLGIRPLPELEALVQGAGRTLFLLPPAWFACDVLRAVGAADSVPRALLAIPHLGTTAAVAALVFAALSNLGCRGAHPVATLGGGSLLPVLGGLLRVKASERATFDLTLTGISRDPDLAFRAGPIFAFPAALLLVGAAVKPEDERNLFVHVLLFVSSAYLPASVQLLGRSRAFEARFVFDTAPIASAEPLRSGVFKAAVVLIGLPFFVLLTLADVAVRGPATALTHAPVVGVVGVCVLDHAVRQLPDPFPFGRDVSVLGGSAGEGVVGLAFVLTLFAFGEAAWIQSPLAALGLAGILAVLLALRRRAARRAAP